MAVVADVLYLLLFLFFIVLLGRLVFDLVQVFARDWRPRGVVLLIVETIYTITDPPLNLLRRIIPPIRLGSVQFDLGFLILLIGVQILMGLVSTLG